MAPCPFRLFDGAEAVTAIANQSPFLSDAEIAQMCETTDHVVGGRSGTCVPGPMVAEKPSGRPLLARSEVERALALHAVWAVDS